MGRKRKTTDADEDDAAGSSQAASAACRVPMPEAWGLCGAGLEPDVIELCDKYYIDEFHTKKLNEILQGRGETFDDDILRLWTDLAEARNPNGLLVAHMRQMEEGTFVGQCQPDPEIAHLLKKFQLDKEASKRLTDCVCRHPPAKRQMYYGELEVHLDASHKPSAAVMMLLRKIKDGEPLGAPDETKGGGKGKGKDKDKGDRRDGDRRDAPRGSDRNDRDDRDGKRDWGREERSSRGQDDRDRDRDRDRGGNRDGARGSDRDRDRDRDR